MHMNLDPFLVDKIVGEVKSQGVFDQFRKDSMSDVDTKPAYQNLRQRVETSVSKFLADLKWKPDINKNQLREKLRKHITDAGFLDTGVERIVDQVVNPKISTVFQPKIEHIAYKYLGIEKPQVKASDKILCSTNGTLTIKTDLLPTDLEAVSPDSDKVTNNSEYKEDFPENLLNDSEDKNEDFESPPFEPLEGRPPSPIQKEESNHSHLSGISGLTSQDSLLSETDLNLTKETCNRHESGLSQVSSNSRLSIVTHEEEKENKVDIKTESGVDISEEAQMPKFGDGVNSFGLDAIQSLHFDIKKEEIQFKGTDRKLDIPIYGGISKNYQIIGNKFSGDFGGENIIKSEQLLKNDDTSSMIYSNSETQESFSCKTEDYEKDVNITSTDTSSYNSGSSQINKEDVSSFFKECSMESCELKVSPLHNTDKDGGNKSKLWLSKARSHYKCKKSETEKFQNIYTKRKEEKNKNKFCRRSPSDEREYKSNSEKSKSENRNCKDNRTKKLSSEKYERETQNKNKKSEKGDDHSLARSKEHRRKSTESDDGDSNRDGQKRTIFIKTECVNNSKKSTESSNNVASDATGSGQSQTDSAMHSNNDSLISEENRRSKPVILDDYFKKDKFNLKPELMIGSNIHDYTNKNNCCPSDRVKMKEKKKGDNAELLYFETDSLEEEEILATMKHISSIIVNMSAERKIYLMDCQEEIVRLFDQSLVNIVNISETTDKYITKSKFYCKNAEREPSILDISMINNISDINPQYMNKRKTNFLPECEVVSPLFGNSKRRRASHEYYSVSYRMISDKDIESDNTGLIIDCLECNVDSFSSNKKFKRTTTEQNGNELLPNPLDSKISSKENTYTEKVKGVIVTDKNIEIGTKTMADKKNLISLKGSQRYSNEDLYKPRPVLSNRSRRRALDAEII